MRCRPRLILFVLLLLLPVHTAWAWLVEGHRMVGVAAVEALPESVPEFFRHGRETVGHGAVDPDVWKHPETPQLRNGESPEHYLDSELLRGRPWSATRYEFLAQLAKTGLDPQQVGLLPYAILEGTQRLALAFAEHRRWPKDRHIQMKCLIYAGVLAHYAADLVMPLHTTIHHDGRARPDGSSPRTGIHFQVDSLLERVEFDRQGAVQNLTPDIYPDLFQALVREFQASHRLVDRVYKLEPLLGALEESQPVSPRLVEFTRDRYRAAVRFTASLFFTAWKLSEDLELPGWLERRGDCDSPSPLSSSFCCQGEKPPAQP